jgi:queuine tRNA-ribosyltransferase/7-cyano-7-deazaguanine tRNA-ribosyltransferase
MDFSFKVLKNSKDCKARLGILKTPHGIIHTPAFVPVATKGALRGIDLKEGKKFGAEIFMVNTYHFFYQERYKIVKKFGGLHSFLNFHSPLMTDSGGFQVFSLGFGIEHQIGKIGFFPKEKNVKEKKKGFVKIFDEGVEFKEPNSGKKIFLTPETSIKVQEILGADFIFAFDECTSPFHDYQYTKKSIERTHRWAERCLKVFNKKGKQRMFGIVQGGNFKDLREESALFISSLPFFGIGIGGPMGKDKKEMHQILEWTIPLLPKTKPRHLLGIGEIEDIFEIVQRGVDLFDCVLATRLARHGTVFTERGKIHLRSSKYLKEKIPLDLKCQCPTCQFYSRAYLCHLLREKEIFAIPLLTAHNLFWILNLLKKIRESIKEGKFLKFKREFLKRFSR